MNPAVETGIAAIAISRLKHAPRSPELSAPDLEALRQTSNRFFEYKLGRADGKGEKEKLFACSDQAAFLDRIGASDVQKAHLDGAVLRLRISDFPNDDYRWGVLIADGLDTLNSGQPTQEMVMSFSATRPDIPAPTGSLDILDPVYKEVQAHSPEHADIEAIADFFPPRLP